MHITFELFMVEVIVALRMMKRQKQLRSKYIAELVFGKKSKTILILIWNSLNVFGVVFILLYWMVEEGIKVGSLGDNEEENRAMMINKGDFTLYPLCIFQGLDQHAESIGDY